MYGDVANCCCRQNQLPSALASLSQAQVMVREGSDLSKEILITMATALLAMGDFNQSLRYIHVHILRLSIQYLLYCHLFRLVDMILKTEKNCVAALLVKADSLFNLCLFERALVLYHRWKDTNNDMLCLI